MTVLFDRNAPLRGILIGSSLQVARIASKTVDTFPCMMIHGNATAGKSTSQNVVAWAARPKDDEEYKEVGKFIRR